MKGKHLILFDTESEYQEYRANNYLEPWVSATKDKIIIE